MCGIAGLILTGEQPPSGLDPHRIMHRMIERLRHRGPEAIRIKRYNNDSCWLAHARLRVTDEREIADQPFTSQNSRWKLVFNGEIYNWKQLDAYLRQTDWKPKTNGDTERLAEIIDRVGIECLHSIDGMFAFGAYDKLTSNLFLARDRFGQKPLFYVSSNGITAFASELSSLMELSPWIPMQVSINGMSQYFSLRYVPAPHTAIEPIRKLEPGQYAVINKQGNILLDRFFTPTKQGTLCSNDWDQTAVQQLNKNPTGAINSLIKESVRNTVPEQAAIIVSGGVDSTLIAAYTADLDKQMGWDTSHRQGYTIQLEHQPNDEALWAKALCQRWGWEHNLLTLTDRQLINAYLRISERLDEPLGDRSLLPSWCLSQAIQPHQRVAIGGDGGDELFLGYERYLTLAPQLAKIGDKENWASLYWKHGLPVGDHKAIAAANKEQGLHPLKLLEHQMRIIQAEHNHSPIEFLQLIDLLNYLPGSVLAKADRSSMDWGLEIRSPLLNTRLALAGLALEPKHLIQKKELKKVLRQLLTIKAGQPPKGRKLGFGASIQHGSELEQFLKQKAASNLNYIVQQHQGEAIPRWLASFAKATEHWSQNSLFSLNIWLDWLVRIEKEFPSIKTY